MVRKKITDQEKEILLKNPCILKIGARNITYSNEFKLKAIKEHQNGKMPMQIFIDARINVDIIGREKPKWCLKSWNKIFKNQGETGLLEEQRGNIGRPRTTELSTDEQLRRAKAKIAYLKAENDFLKKAEGSRKGGDITATKKFQIIYGAISKAKNLKVKHLCKIANVSRSGYYHWLESKEYRRLKDKEDLEIIKKIFDEKHQKAGWRTIRMILENKHGKIMNHKKIRRIKNEYGLNTKIRRKNPYKTLAKKTQEHSTCPNILDRKFDVVTPYRVYSTDITYLFYGKGKKAYLSAVKDLATKEIVGHYLSKNIDMELVFSTLTKTIEFTPISYREFLMLHSDQGFHYTNPNFKQKLKDLKITQSMSRKGNCLDNAPIESFFGHFKDELDYSNCDTFEELETKVNEYIYDYNNNRYQWTLKKMTPVQYRDHLLVA